MTNRTVVVDWVTAAIFVGAMALACASPTLYDAYQRVLDCPHYDCPHYDCGE